MQTIPLTEAKSGMILARDLFRTGSSVGIPICGKDTELSDILIERFANMGVQEIEVTGHPVYQDGDRSIGDILLDLNFRFSKTLDNPLNIVLHNIYKTSLTNSMGGSCDRQAE